MSISWPQLPSVGDIVWTKFPIDIGQPGPKPRPALVTKVSPSTNEVEVAYGTSQKTGKPYQGEFVVSNTDPEFSSTGLSYSTKFNLLQTVKLPFDNIWFEKSPGYRLNNPPPKMGSLGPHSRQNVRNILTLLKQLNLI